MATEAAWLGCKVAEKGENKKRKPSLQEGKRKSLLTLTGLLMEGPRVL